MTKSSKDSHIFLSSSHLFRDINIHNFFNKKIENFHRVQFSQWRHWMENFKICKRPTCFCASSNRFRDIKIFNFWLSKNRSRTQNDGNIPNLQTPFLATFIFARARDYNTHTQIQKCKCTSTYTQTHIHVQKRRNPFL